jgi:hypothetical protein
MQRLPLFGFLLLLVTAPASFASGPATLEDLSWLAGEFESITPLGALNETRILEPRARVMTGMMRLTKDGALWVQEFFTLRETDAGEIQMRLQHFDAELKRIDTSDFALRLVSWDGSTARFEPIAGGNVRYTTITRTEAGWNAETESVNAKGEVHHVRSTMHRRAR